MTAQSLLDPAELLQAVALRIPEPLRDNVVVIGSIATAWAFRDVMDRRAVATKDIDLLLRPSVDAVSTAETLGAQLLAHRWSPHYPDGVLPATADTPDHALPALRLRPPEGDGQWFVELLAEPPAWQGDRKYWRRFETSSGTFGLPSFRYLGVAINAAESTEWGLRVARPACMALAHLLEHAEPDTTPIASLPGGPSRFVKDVGRAVSLWWLAREQSSVAATTWAQEWAVVLQSLEPEVRLRYVDAAQRGLASIEAYLPEAHAIAVVGVLEASRTSFDAYRRAFGTLQELLAEL